MEPLGLIVAGVVVLGVVVGIYFSRMPPPWDEIGGLTPGQTPGDGREPNRVEDEAELRALVARKRAARQATPGATTVASDARRDAAAQGGEPWSHLDAELVEEARGLVARRRARFERTGRPVPDEDAELRRLLGPPTP